MNSEHEKCPTAQRGCGGPGSWDGGQGMPVIIPIIAQTKDGVKVSVARGGPTCWAAIDAIHTLARELVSRDLVADGAELAEAIQTAWTKMLAKAEYLDRGEVAEVLGEVGREY